MRVYVLGGLHYIKAKNIFNRLDALHSIYNFDELLLSHSPGGATVLARAWAELKGIPIVLGSERIAEENLEAHNKRYLDLKPDLVVFFPGGRVIKDTIKYWITTNVPMILEEDRLWELERTLHSELEEVEADIALDLMSLHAKQDLRLEASMISILGVSTGWLEKFRSLSYEDALQAAIKIVPAGATLASAELALVDKDRAFVNSKYCSPLKSANSKKNGKKGGRPKKEVSEFIDKVLSDPKPSDWIEPVKEPRPVVSFTKNPGPVKVSKL